MMACSGAVIGHTGQGQFARQLGLVDCPALMVLGRHATGLGQYDLQGGTLLVSGELDVGRAGDGVFEHTGGVATVYQEVEVGSLVGSDGRYPLNGPNAGL